MPSTVPLATYRLQLTKDFGFREAAELAPYLRALGISHLYASPFLKARPGSTHGYDIVDHDQLNPELGGEDGFARLSAALKDNGLKLILDFVPNHMGVGHADNAWWLDVLEWGPKSIYATAFDIDWDGLPYRRHPGVLIPILGRPYGDALTAGEIALRYDAPEGSFAAWYCDHKLPINPQRYDEMLRTIVTAAEAADEPAGCTLNALADRYRSLTAPSYRDAPGLKKQLAEIDGAGALIERGLSAYSPDSETGTAALHRLLERQYYRLAYWRVAFSAVNYRRFFDINDLAGLRVENSATFHAIHRLVARLIASDQLQGLRLDHIDGLRDPAQYTSRLRQLIRKLPGRRQSPFYVIVEKILADGEPKPQLPGVAGTTGYEWLNVISRVLVDGSGLDRLERTWREFTGEQSGFSDMLKAAKRTVIDTMLASEFTVLARALSRIAAGHFSTRDFTMARLRAALQAYVLQFPVYRTYVTASGAGECDRATIEAAVGRARAQWRGPDPDIFDFLRAVITLDLAADPGTSAPRVRNCALKLQQFTGPLMAKSLEDTAFYRHHRLIALNDVGGDPPADALSLDDFHTRQQARAEHAPDGLTATATHDTKRGEDARARILALSELAGEWDVAVRGWRERNALLAQYENGERRPSLAHEYMLYQALVGALPETIDEGFVARMRAFALKAAREGKQETSWTNPNHAYEAGLEKFVGDLLDDKISAEFLSSFRQFSERTTLLGAINGLSQLALKVLLPGVPDFYQGTEFWDLSLVDPDNRRPIDFALRSKELERGPPNWPALAQHWRNGRVKFALTRKLLQLRRGHVDLFRSGDYRPLPVTGRDAGHVIAFARTLKREQLIVAVGRHFGALTDGGRHWPQAWEAAITLGPATYEDALGTHGWRDHEPDLSLLFQPIPVSVLRRV
jgi:(1->4)-alpha-D-glucan 1-alpha-D-glucosylmutase